jgi:hypothetical protein
MRRVRGGDDDHEWEGETNAFSGYAAVDELDFEHLFPIRHRMSVPPLRSG